MKVGRRQKYKSEAVIRRQTDNTLAKGKGRKGQAK